MKTTIKVIAGIVLGGVLLLFYFAIESYAEMERIVNLAKTQAMRDARWATKDKDKDDQPEYIPPVGDVEPIVKPLTPTKDEK